MENKFVIGIDYGTDSVRSIVVNAHTGAEVAAAVYYYPRWKEGLYCDPAQNRFRQHPQDHIEGLEQTILQCLQQAGDAVARQICAISVDTTGSTPVAVDESGTPLALCPGFEQNPNAMFVLWKDHTAVKEAAQINTHAAAFPDNYLRFVGGIYSSEWFWAKLLHILRVDESVRNACHSWVEHCDWIPFLLTGGKHVKDMKRGVCGAGHKALWAEEFGGFPPNSFFASLDPLLDGFTARLSNSTYTADQAAGRISKEWAERLGLPDGVLIGTGAFDAHMGAVGGQIEPYHLSKVMGTSTCDMLVAPQEAVGLVKGICGQVPGSIIPGMMGLEAGQSAFGDVYAWFKQLLSWPSGLLQGVVSDAFQQVLEQLLPELTRQAAALPPDLNAPLAIDWLNGRRTPDANQSLKGAITGIDLSTDAPKLFRSLVEATCFGAKAIADRFLSEGVPVKGLIGMGGVARKSPAIMQIMADVMNMPIRIHRSEQTCAFGAAMFAATVAGIYPKVEDAMQAMGQGFDREYRPNPGHAAIYATRYEHYLNIGNFMVHHTTQAYDEQV